MTIWIKGGLQANKSAGDTTNDATISHAQVES